MGDNTTSEGCVSVQLAHAISTSFELVRFQPRSNLVSPQLALHNSCLHQRVLHPTRATSISLSFSLRILFTPCPDALGPARGCSKAPSIGTAAGVTIRGPALDDTFDSPRHPLGLPIVDISGSRGFGPLQLQPRHHRCEPDIMSSEPLDALPGWMCNQRNPPSHRTCQCLHVSRTGSWLPVLVLS